MPFVDENNKDLETRYKRLSFLYSELSNELDELEKKGLALKREIAQIIDENKMSAILTKLKNNQ
jgi:hypothetical protein